MTAPAQRSESQSTAVALRDPLGIGNLPDAVQQQLELRKLSNQVAGELAKINWGAKLDLPTRRAVADWGRQFRVDVTTEIHILGGNVYLNAAFFLRQLSELIASGVVEYAFADHIEDDPRLAKLGAEGEGEASRRLRERITHGVPDKAASAVVFRVKLRSMDKEVTGCKWCGNGTRKNDPVGDDKPMETAESRAARRAMRLLATHVPRHVADEIEAIEESAEGLSERVIDFKQQDAIREASQRRAPQLPPAVNPRDPYDTDPHAGARPHAASMGERIERIDAHEAASSAASMRDPYDERSGDSGSSSSSVGAEARSQSQPASVSATPASIDERAPLDEPTATKRVSAYTMRFGGEYVGRPISEVPTPDLMRLLEWAEKRKDQTEFIEAAKVEIDDRRWDDEAGA